MSAHWTMDSFGATLPTNWEDIAAAANDLLAAYTGEEPDEYSEDLWEQFCDRGEINGVQAVYRLEDLDPVDVIETITGTRKSAETACRNGAVDELYTPEDFVDVLRNAADDDETTDYEAILAQALAGDLHMDGVHNGIIHGTPFVWMHG